MKCSACKIKRNLKFLKQCSFYDLKPKDLKRLTALKDEQLNRTLNANQKAELKQLNESRCKRLYHLNCIESIQDDCHFNLWDPWDVENEFFYCSLHICLSCHNEYLENCSVRNKRMELIICNKCPTAYHNNKFCIAAGSQSEDDQLICPAHLKYNKKIHTNVDRCFFCDYDDYKENLLNCVKCPAAYHYGCINDDENLEHDLYQQFSCSDCNAKKQFHINDLIWVKLNKKWWPAQIKELNEYKNKSKINVNKKIKFGNFPVYLFGSGVYGIANKANSFLYKYGINDKWFNRAFKKKSHTSTKEFANAIDQIANAFKCLKDDKESVLGEKKPKAYVKIQRNQQIKGFTQKKSSEFTDPCSCFNQKLTCNEDDQCINVSLRVECHNEICSVGDNCENRKFRNRAQKKFEIFKSITGWGLRCLEDIERNEFVIEYVGELMNETQLSNRKHQMVIRNCSDFYFMEINPETFIDGLRKSNLARFINHSCDPNLETEKWLVLNKTCVGLFANKNIPKLTELTFNYGNKFWNENTKCLCNSKRCRGYLNNKHDSKCFKCNKEPKKDKIVSCEKPLCPKVYHLSCVGLKVQNKRIFVCKEHRQLEPPF